MPYEGVRKGSRPPMLERYFAHCARQVAPSMRVMARDLGKSTVEWTKVNTPVSAPVADPDRPGRTLALMHRHLRDRIKMRKVMVYDLLGMAVYMSGAETEVDYAPYVEEGTGLWGPTGAPYEIKPIDPLGVLHWVVAGGEHVFAKRVMHPGSPGQHMFAIGIAMAEGRFHETVQDGLREFVRRCEDYKDDGGRVRQPRAEEKAA